MRIPRPEFEKAVLDDLKDPSRPKRPPHTIDPPPVTSGVGTKSHGIDDMPRVIPPLPSPDPSVAIALVEQRVAELDAICVTALASGLSLHTAAKLINEEHGPGSKLSKSRGYDFDRRQVWVTLKRIDAELAEDLKGTVANERARQVERLRRDLARMRAKASPPFSAIKQHEELLARLTGTMQPIRVEVDVLHTLKQSIAVVIGDLTEADRDRIVAEQLMLESAAQAAE